MTPRGADAGAGDADARPISAADLERADYKRERERAYAIIARDVVAGGPHRLDEAEGASLAIVVGLEAATMVRGATGVPTWAVPSARDLEDIDVPDGVVRVELWCATADRPAAERYGQRLAGREVAIFTPAAGIASWVDAHRADGDRALWSATGRPPAGRVDVGVWASDVRRERMEWLWAGRIARRKVTLISGDPDVGKTTLLLDVLARITTGEPMPLEHERRDAAGVVIVSAEDDAADTLRPRLEAAGADLSRVLILRLSELPEIPGSLETLEAAIAKAQAAAVMLDPLAALLGDRVDAYRDHHVRRALTPLAEMAQRTRAAIVAVRHLRKSGGAAKHAGGGSIAITAAARSELIVAPDPDDETGERRVFARAKNNLAAPVPAIAYRLVPVTLSPESGSPADAPPHVVVAVDWQGESSHTADELIAASRASAEPERDAHREERETTRNARSEAERWLGEMLAPGWQATEAIQAAASEAGLSWATVRRAKDTLRVRARKSGLSGPWGWELPGPDREGADASKAEGAHSPTDASASEHLEHLRENPGKEPKVLNASEGAHVSATSAADEHLRGGRLGAEAAYGGDL